MNERKRLYEITFIVNASLEDPQVDAYIARLQEFILRNGGEIKATNKWGRKRLAYPIQKKNNGYYVNIEFDAPTSSIAQLERTLLLDENILRFLTLQVDRRALKARQRPTQPSTQETGLLIPEASDLDREPLFEDEIDEAAEEKPL
ncbi:MAG: 30S ribosomal protein S6 [Ignavibacteriae bacterium]|nr:30S ribosomal protein S6 [Ignavibacteriota bacterium]